MSRDADREQPCEIVLAEKLPNVAHQSIRNFSALQKRSLE
jgi:hypothetical protein